MKRFPMPTFIQYLRNRRSVFELYSALLLFVQSIDCSTSYIGEIYKLVKWVQY